jgi:hypothetical protein
MGGGVKAANGSFGGKDEDQDAEGMDADTDNANHGAISLKWNRIGIVDLLIMYGIMETVIYYWELFSTDFVVF